MTVHDLTFVRQPDYYAPALREFLSRWIDASLSVADRIVAISEASRKDLVELKGIPAEQIDVVQQPVRETFLQPLADQEIRELLKGMGIAAPYYFHVSNLSPHKNVLFAVKAFARSGLADRG